MKTKIKSVKRKTTVEDQLENHSTRFHKKPNLGHLSTSDHIPTHMYGEGSAFNIDESLIGSSHDVGSQLSTMGLTPAINDNDNGPLACKLEYT